MRTDKLSILTIYLLFRESFRYLTTSGLLRNILQTVYTREEEEPQEGEWRDQWRERFPEGSQELKVKDGFDKIKREGKRPIYKRFFLVFTGNIKRLNSVSLFNVKRPRDCSFSSREGPSTKVDGAYVCVRLSTSVCVRMGMFVCVCVKGRTLGILQTHTSDHGVQ